MTDPSVSFKEERVVKPHSEPIYACAISPDGSLVATGSRDKTVDVIDAATGNVIYTTKHDYPACGVAWHPDGNRLLAVCWDGILTEVTRLNRKWSHRSVYKHADGLAGCAVSENGLVAVGCGDNCVVILDPKSNYSVKQKIPDLAFQDSVVSFSSDGSLLAIGCPDGTHFVYCLNQSNGRYERLTARRQHTNCIGSLSFSPSDSHLVIGCFDNTASLWIVPSNPINPSTWSPTPSFVLKGHDQVLRGTCFTGDGRHVITGAEEPTIRIWCVSDGGHVATINAMDEVTSVSFHSPTGRLVAGLYDGSLQSWLCPPHGTSPYDIPTAFVDVHLRLSKAKNDLSDIESKLSSIDPSVRDAVARAAHIRNEIVRHQQLIDEFDRELASIETGAMKEAFKNIAALEEHLQFAQGEISNCNRIIDHVTECYSTKGYFSSLQSGVFFDQWLFDSGLSHICDELTEMNGETLVHMTIYDLMEEGNSYVNACDIHIRACLTAHTQTVGVLPNVFNWDKDQVSTWLQSQGDTYASLLSLGWTGPSLIALTPNRIESSSNKAVNGESARALKKAIVSLIDKEDSIPSWMRIWNGGMSVDEYSKF